MIGGDVYLFEIFVLFFCDFGVLKFFDVVGDDC